MTKERRLGRGLAALLGAEPGAQSKPPAQESSPAPPENPAPQIYAPDDPAEPAEPAEGDTVMLGVYEIDNNPFQPRRQFREAEIAAMAESLKEHDMLQPVLVRRTGDRYQLISGERRLRAAIHAGLDKVPARIREADDRLVAELAIVENLHREDLNPIEKALSFKRYIDEHQCRQDDLAQRLKINRSTIANLMRLLDLPDKVQDAVGRGDITAGHARALLTLGSAKAQTDFCGRIQADGLSVRETERLVQEQSADPEDPKLNVVGGGKKRARSEHVASLEQGLRMALGAKVDIRETSKGRGKIVINFKNHEEFERIFQYLTDSSPSDNALGAG